MRVKVTIYDDHGGVVHEGVVIVSIGREACEAIDFPRPGADPMLATACCTPEPRRKHIAYVRGAIAKAIADEMTSFFEAHDTEMGYPIVKEAFHG